MTTLSGRTVTTVEERKKKERKKDSASADGGPRSRVCARLTLAEIFRHTCLQSSQGGDVKFSNENSDKFSRQIRQF